MENASIEQISKDVILLKKMVGKIQEHLEDCFLTAEEDKILDESFDDLKKGIVYSLDDIKRR